jgi:hypothetical protein
MRLVGSTAVLVALSSCANAPGDPLLLWLVAVACTFCETGANPTAHASRHTCTPHQSLLHVAATLIATRVDARAHVKVTVSLSFNALAWPLRTPYSRC